MKVFLKNVFLFVFPLLLLGFGSEVLIRKIPNDYLYKKESLDKCAKNIEVLFLGNSHFFYGVNPAFIQKKSFNAACASQSLNFDFEIMKKYQNDFKNLKYIVLPIDYLSLFTTIEKSKENWRVKNYNLYFDINYNYALEDNSELFSNNLKTNFKKLKYYYIKKQNTLTTTSLGWGNGFDSKNNQDLIKSGKESAIRHRSDDVDIFNQNIVILKSIVEFAKTNHIQLLLISSPVYKTYIDNLNPYQMNKTIQVAKDLDERYKNVKYINWMNNKAFVKSDFYDADHLNNIGAEKLSKKLNYFLN
ncbi:hypothetical protein [Flavobacterium sp.]|uniref:hypothetical protein n=1 Tax=Flavobacterium sp. TaxID=239 RepID=UPI00286D9A2A|nr:hypothetical protein [Flavobacterium sp.]